MKILSLIASVDKVLQRMIVPIVVVLSLSVAGGLVLGIIMRSVFRAPMLGLEELILFSVMWLYMLGAALASRDRSHLSADVATIFVSSAKARRIIRIVASLITLIMVCAFVVWSYDLFIWGWENEQSTPVFQLPMYLSQASLFCASLLFLFYGLRDLITDLSEVDL